MVATTTQLKISSKEHGEASVTPAPVVATHLDDLSSLRRRCCVLCHLLTFPFLPPYLLTSLSHTHTYIYIYYVRTHESNLISNLIGKVTVNKLSSSSKNSKHSISPDQSDEMVALRARNKVLTDTLKAIQQTAKAELDHKYDLVWFAKYRCKCGSVPYSSDFGERVLYTRSIYVPLVWFTGLFLSFLSLYHYFVGTTFYFHRPVPEPRGIETDRSGKGIPGRNPKAP